MAYGRDSTKIRELLAALGVPDEGGNIVEATMRVRPGELVTIEVVRQVGEEAIAKVHDVLCREAAE